MARKVTIAEQTRIIALYKAGWSTGQISKMLNRSASTILSLLVRNGIPRRSRLEYRDSYNRVDYNTLKLAHHLYHERGMLAKEIAEHMGIAPSTVGRYLRRYGTPIRTRAVTMHLTYERGYRKRDAHQPQAALTRKRKNALTRDS